MKEAERMSPEEIVEALDQEWTTYPRQIIQAAMDQREEVTPLFLAFLRDLRSDLHDPQFEVPDSMLPVLSFHLLGYFREAEAHQVIIELATAPPDIADGLFGDLLTQDLAAFLWMTSNGNVGAVKKLIARQDVNPYIRGEGIMALTYGIAEGALERDDVVRFVQRLFSDATSTDPEAIFLSIAACTLNDLHPGDSMKVIRAAFADGLVDPEWIKLEEIEHKCERPKEEVLARFLESQRVDLAKDPHKRMSWWACFRSEEPLFKPVDLTQQRNAQHSNLTQAERNKKKAARKRRKAAKRKSTKTKKKRRR